MRTNSALGAWSVLAAVVGLPACLSGCANTYTCADYKDCTPAVVDGGIDGHMGVDAADAPVSHHEAGADATTDARGAEASKPEAGMPEASKAEGGKAEGGKLESGVEDAMKDVAHDTFTCNGTKSPSEEPCVISEAYGVFVAPPADGGSDSGAGTRAAPYATITKAIQSANGKRVYACSATYPEALSVTVAVDGTSIYGGLMCPGSDSGSTWTYVTGTRALVEPSAVGYALDVQGLVKGAHFEDVGFVAQPAPVATSGGSSIAVMVSGSTAVSFTRVSAKAGAGVAGVSAAAPATNWCNPATGPQAGAAATGTGGGNSGLCTCAVATGDNSSGGAGGSKALIGSNGGSVPTVTGTVSPIDGVAGDGSSTVGSGGVCANGHQGANGAAVTLGGTAGTAGMLGTAGWIPLSAGSGSPGNPGEGGGGGGGNSTVGGAGGGAGGCGGNGGVAGGGGGASIAVAVLSSTVAFASMTLTTSTGGSGGSGAGGEAGQVGAPATFGGAAGGCNGGAGGAGAGGAGGGGGAGGPSVGIAWTGVSSSLTVDGTAVTTEAALTSPSTFTSGGGGTSGAGGTGGIVTGGNVGPAGSPGPAGSSNAVVGF